MAYEPAYEQFAVVGRDARRRAVEFKKAGFLAVGDQPELYFFSVDGEEVVVGLSGAALRELQRRWRYLAREEKIDLAGLFLKRQIEAGKPLVAENLYIREQELEGLVSALGLRP